MSAEQYTIRCSGLPKVLCTPGTVYLLGRLTDVAFCDIAINNQLLLETGVRDKLCVAYSQLGQGRGAQVANPPVSLILTHKHYNYNILLTPPPP